MRKSLNVSFIGVGCSEYEWFNCWYLIYWRCCFWWFSFCVCMCVYCWFVRCFVLRRDCCGRCCECSEWFLCWDWCCCCFGIESRRLDCYWDCWWSCLWCLDWWVFLCLSCWLWWWCWNYWRIGLFVLKWWLSCDWRWCCLWSVVGDCIFIFWGWLLGWFLGFWRSCCGWLCFVDSVVVGCLLSLDWCSCWVVLIGFYWR